MGRRGFISTLNSIARETARQQRRAEAELRRQARANLQYQRQCEREQRLADKEEKQRYLEQRFEETEDNNLELAQLLESLNGILDHTLSVDDTIRFESLKINAPFEPPPTPQALAKPHQQPQKQDYLSKVKPLGILEKFFGMKKRYEEDIAAAESQYATAKAAFAKAEEVRKVKLAEFLAAQEKARQCYIQKAEQRNQEVDDLEKSYKNCEPQAVITYNTLVLERSEYPEGFPQEFRLAFSPESKQLVVDYDMPGVSIIPTEVEFKYVKAKDSIESKPRKSNDIKELYQDIVASIALRTVHEIFESDQGSHIDVVVFNGFVHAIDPSTGREVHPCILSVRTTRDLFMSINLAQVEKRACLRSLGAQVSNQPQALQPVKPIVEFDMIDKRFIEQGDIISELDSRPNLMDLNPFEFEALVSNLFGKMGLESKLTRTSKDGGVDAVAYDIRPVLGGKVVIQAKRYKNTVGVSAVRDLYGTMLNEGANKGILVTTSGYGPDAFDFSKDKPIELIDGGGLLFLLDQVGISAKIIFPEDFAPL
ncbi:restriction endonuclease [Oryzomonas rubra]|uniref:Restriction endonuclease n=1 Tax=Oryzomonas rubra TaxID=2509454 RepID=A0A5A9XP14_9BACT|nr:restriction endonuclease [Oryzomonas rubra]KAA0894285.1 restriction endonuclease [Oryzomonas rubra]